MKYCATDCANKTLTPKRSTRPTCMSSYDSIGYDDANVNT